MIKVPGTEAGLPAIEELTRRGVNVNITLLFSIERYEQVIDAYLRGLTRPRRGRRAARHDRLGRVVLRLADRHEGRRSSCRRTRRCAVASRSPTRAVAYQRYLTKFAGARSGSASRALGATRQRPLWASTGTKDPRLLRRALRLGADRTRRDQHDARADAARVRRPRRGRPARSTPTRGGQSRRSSDATAAGIDLDAVTAELEREGVQSFCDSYHELLDCIEGKLGVIAAS